MRLLILRIQTYHTHKNRKIKNVLVQESISKNIDHVTLPSGGGESIYDSIKKIFVDQNISMSELVVWVSIVLSPILI